MVIFLSRACHLIKNHVLKAIRGFFILHDTPFGFRTQLTRGLRWFLKTFQRLVSITIFYQKWDKWNTIEGCFRCSILKKMRQLRHYKKNKFIYKNYFSTISTSTHCQSNGSLSL